MYDPFVPDPLTRRGLLRVAAAGAFAAGAVPGLARGSRNLAPALEALSVESAAPFAGDRPLLATVDPASAERDRAVLRFLLDRPARVLVEAVQVGQSGQRSVWEAQAQLPRGRHRFLWKPAPDVKPGTYVMRLTVEGSGRRRVYGQRRPLAPELARAPVVRVLGVEAAFDERSYAPGQRARLTVEAAADTLTLEILRSGPELENTDRNDELKGVAVTEPVTHAWQAHRHRPGSIELAVGDWPSGLYFARLTADSGRVGFAPFVVRPETLGTSKVAVVLPTNTWQAYNFRDTDGDGWGDTWYAGGSPPVVLDRPYLNRGVPPRFRRYDLPFIKWLHWTGKTPDYLCDEDIARLRDGDELRRAYDLVIFPGHTEYVTEHGYDVVQRYRDLGGNLIFLSANNFFWKVERRGASLRRVALWRQLGRPESAVLGNQYLANDDGTKQGVFYVTDATSTPWLWEGTGLGYGSTLGEFVGGYGIEIDATTEHSPPGTKVLAVIPNLFGLGKHAEMTYYESPAGARVFAAGAMDFGGSATFWPVRRLLENLWQHLIQP
jgi:hypothetical protein